MDHSAQQIIGAALRSEDGQRVLEWLRDFCLDAAHPSFAASVLRCLGRQEAAGDGRMAHRSRASSPRHGRYGDKRRRGSSDGIVGRGEFTERPLFAFRARVVASTLY